MSRLCILKYPPAPSTSFREVKLVDRCGSGGDCGTAGGENGIVGGGSGNDDGDRVIGGGWYALYAEADVGCGDPRELFGAEDGGVAEA